MIKVNGIEIKPTIFPDGTSQVWKLPEEAIDKEKNVVVWEFESESELIHLAQLKRLLPVTGKTYLHIPFLPYGRQDKEVSNKATFALQVFAHLINVMNFTKVLTLDAHSEKFEKWVLNSTSLFPSSEIDEAINLCKPDIICFPDKGAEDRYGAYISDTHKNIRIIIGEKTRNQETGYIEEYRVIGDLEHPVKKKRVLIIDDICDGGMTFKILAEKLKGMGAAQVDLYTTHGIYSKGIDTLTESGIHNIINRKIVGGIEL